MSLYLYPIKWCYRTAGLFPDLDRITATIVKLRRQDYCSIPGGMSSMDMLFNDLIVEYRDKPG